MSDYGTDLEGRRLCKGQFHGFFLVRFKKLQRNFSPRFMPQFEFLTAGQTTWELLPESDRSDEYELQLGIRSKDAAGLKQPGVSFC